MQSTLKRLSSILALFTALGLCSPAHAITASLDSFTFQPPGTDNAIVFSVPAGSWQPISGGFQVDNTVVFVGLPGGLSLALPVTTLVLSGPAGALTAASGSLSTMPDVPGGWPGALAGLTPSGGPLTFSAVTGQQYVAANGDQRLLLSPNRNFLQLFPQQGATLPALGFVSTLLQTAQDNVNNQVQLLIDPTDPGIYTYVGPFGLGAAFGLDSMAIGLSANSTIPFTPNRTGDLPAGTLTPFSGGFFAAGAYTIPDVNLTLSGKGVFDLAPGLSTSGRPVQMGFNGTASLTVPYLTDLLTVRLQLGDATAGGKWTDPGNSTFAFDAAGGGDAAQFVGLPLTISPSPGQQVHASGLLHRAGGNFAADSFVKVGGRFDYGFANLLANAKGGARGNNIPGTTGELSIGPGGVSVSGTVVSVTPLTALQFETQSTSFSAYFDPNKVDFTASVSGNAALGGVTLANVVATVQPSGVTAKAVLGLKQLNVALAGTVDAAGAVLTGTATIDAAINLDAGALAQAATDATVCKAEQSANATLCGVHAVTDAAICGSSAVTDAARCGVHSVTDAGACGVHSVTSAALCGTHAVQDGATCGYNFIKDGLSCGWYSAHDCFFHGRCGPKKCNVANTCNVASTCNVANTCNIASTCNIPNTCNLANDCSAVSSCNWTVNVPSGGVHGSVRGSLVATVGSNGTSYALGSGGSLQFCAGSSCQAISGQLSKSGNLPRLCVSNLPTVGGVIRDQYCFDL